MTFLLDTNVLSDIRRRAPAVMQWMRKTGSAPTACSVISIGELAKGVEGRRKTDPILAERLSHWLIDLRSEYADRILPVTTDIAMLWGKIAAARTRDIADGLIAATAITHGLTLVTRNVRDFADLPITLSNPWES